MSDEEVMIWNRRTRSGQSLLRQLSELARRIDPEAHAAGACPLEMGSRRLAAWREARRQITDGEVGGVPRGAGHQVVDTAE